MPRIEAHQNRRRTMNVPWSERGDFVEECIKEYIEQTGKAYSRVMFEILELYFTRHSAQPFYDRVNARVANSERREERRNDVRYREYLEPGGAGHKPESGEGH